MRQPKPEYSEPCKNWSCFCLRDGWRARRSGGVGSTFFQYLSLIFYVRVLSLFVPKFFFNMNVWFLCFASLYVER
jgi:hypothetical protein